MTEWLGTYTQELSVLYIYSTSYSCCHMSVTIMQ